MVGARVARITIMIAAEVAPGTDLPAVALPETRSNNSLAKMAKVAQNGETLTMTSARQAHRRKFNLHRPLVDETTLEKATRKLTITEVGKKATTISLVVIKADTSAPIVAIRVRKIKASALGPETIHVEVIRRLVKVAAMLDRN